MSAFELTYEAVFRKHPKLAPGERGVAMCLACDREQAGVVFNYVRAFFREIPMLARLVAAERSDSIVLTNGIEIAVHTSSFRSVRGYTLLAVVADEIAFWPNESSADPAEEVLAAVRPGLTTTNGLLLCISSPHVKRGPFYTAFQTYYGPDASDEAMYWRGTTREMNCSFPELKVQRALEQDESSARAEYLAEWRLDLESFVSREKLAECVVPGRLELPPAPSSFRYVAAVDPSGGSGGDASRSALPTVRNEAAWSWRS